MVKLYVATNNLNILYKIVIVVNFKIQNTIAHLFIVALYSLMSFFI